MKASELFFGLCRYYSSLGLDKDVSWSSYGLRTMSYFDQLGRMLGYNVRTEDTLTSDEEWKCPEKLRNKRIDMVWMTPEKNLYVVAIEHQGSKSPEKIKLDIEKLAQIGCLKVLVVYGQDTGEVKNWIKDILKKTEDTKGDFLLVSIPYYFDKTPPEKLQARLLDRNGKILGSGIAEARREKSTGLDFFANAKWHNVDD